MMNARQKVFQAISGLTFLLVLSAACAPAAVSPTPALPANPAQPKAPAEPAKPQTPAAAPVPTSTPTSVPIGESKGPVVGGTLVAPVEVESGILDPMVTYSYVAMDQVGRVYNSLVRYDKHLKVIGDLADSWQFDSPSSVIFRIHPGVKFHNVPPVNGRELTAEDVKFTFEALAGGTKTTRTFGRLLAIPLVEVQALDKYTARFVFKEPFAPLLGYLVDPLNKVVPKEYGEYKGGFSQIAIGTGPFVFEKYARNSVTVLKRNPDYWRKGLPYIGEIRVPVIADPSTYLATFRAGRADTIVVQTLESLKALKRSVPEVNIKPMEGLTYGIAFNERKPPFDDVRLRQAVLFAIDRQESLLAGVAGTEGGKLVSFFSLGEWATSQELQGQIFKRDVTLAKKLVADAGYPSGLSLQVNISNRFQPSIDASAVYAKQLKDIGISVEFRVIDHAANRDLGAAGDYTMTVAGLLVNRTEPDFQIADIALLCNIKPPQVYYWRYVCDTELDKLILQQRAEIDASKRRQLLFEVDKRVVNQGHMIPHFTGYRYLGWRPNIQSFDPPTLYYQGLESIERAWITKNP